MTLRKGGSGHERPGPDTVRDDAWITIIVGIFQVGAGLSLIKGGGFGRVIAIFAATLGMLEALLSVGGTHPWWSLGAFALCLFVLHGLIVYGEEETARS